MSFEPVLAQKRKLEEAMATQEAEQKKAKMDTRLDVNDVYSSDSESESEKSGNEEMDTGNLVDLLPSSPLTDYFYELLEENNNYYLNHDHGYVNFDETTKPPKSSSQLLHDHKDPTSVMTKFLRSSNLENSVALTNAPAVVSRKQNLSGKIEQSLTDNIQLMDDEDMQFFNSQLSQILTVSV